MHQTHSTVYDSKLPNIELNVVITIGRGRSPKQGSAQFSECIGTQKCKWAGK